jgi:uncharacterized protein YuzE
VEIKQYEAKYSYDYDLDIVNISIEKEYEYNGSIELEFGVFLDFDENDIPVNLEIISASKIMEIEKECLKNPNGTVIITIEDVIKVEVVFEFEDNHKTLQLKSLNEVSIPKSKINFALI